MYHGILLEVRPSPNLSLRTVCRPGNLPAMPYPHPRGARCYAHCSWCRRGDGRRRVGTGIPARKGSRGGVQYICMPAGRKGAGWDTCWVVEQ
eukprot:3604487-Rhodomonas_salina.1